MLDAVTPIEAQEIPERFRAPMRAIAAAARELSAVIAAGELAAPPAAALGRNTDGDRQVALDVAADGLFRTALAGSGVRWYASEELEEVAGLDPEGELAVAIDPLDGSSNIDVNVALGTIFGFYPAETDARASFLRPGRDILAAGYVIYGPQTALVASFGAGVRKYVLDHASGSFRLAGALSVPARSSEFAINASNYRHWDRPIRAYIDDCLAGATGPQDRDFNMRWIASLVAEVHRIVTRGGVFLYPADARPGYAHGRLRRVYECAPIAFLIEEAGGKATDGCDRLLDQRAAELHERTPFVFGSPERVDRLAAYHDLAESETSALFGKRGLFRSGAR
ncbi:MAG TPA: class 1 fructose-bisphosphatase [Amaricoccus sp.]|nr:class 1 fructose-bisphosphatase [Amaricoccus sp.]